MKAALLLFAFLACSLYPGCRADLQGDIDKILDLIPEDEIKAIVQKYVNRGDPEVLELLNYMTSDQHKRLIVKVRAVPGVQQWIFRLNKKGVNVDVLFQRLFTLLGLPPMEIFYSENSGKEHSAYGLQNMFGEIQAIIPISKIIEVFLETLIGSEDLQEVFEYLQKPETHQTALEILEIEEVKLLIVRLKDNGVDVDKIADQIKTILGW